MPPSMRPHLNGVSWLIAADLGHLTSEPAGTDEYQQGRPIFLIGCHRSGTTLLRYLLDAHPNLACPPESKFVAAFERVLTYPQALRGLESLGISTDRLLMEFGRLTAKLLGEFSNARGKRRWVDKTPNYYRLLSLIDRMFQHQVTFCSSSGIHSIRWSPSTRL
jgi:hypothetical protein